MVFRFYHTYLDFSNIYGGLGYWYQSVQLFLMVMMILIIMRAKNYKPSQTTIQKPKKSKSNQIKQQNQRSTVIKIKNNKIKGLLRVGAPLGIDSVIYSLMGIMVHLDNQKLLVLVGLEVCGRPLLGHEILLSRCLLLAMVSSILIDDRYF